MSQENYQQEFDGSTSLYMSGHFTDQIDDFLDQNKTKIGNSVYESEIVDNSSNLVLNKTQFSEELGQYEELVDKYDQKLSTISGLCYGILGEAREDPEVRQKIKPERFEELQYDIVDLNLSINSSDTGEELIESMADEEVALEKIEKRLAAVAEQYGVEERNRQDIEDPVV